MLAYTRRGLSSRTFAMAEAQTLENAGAEVLQEDVGGPEQRTKHVLAARVLEIERQAALVRVEGQVEQAVRVRPILQHEAGGVALDRLLDLDHVRSEPGQHLAARGSGLIVRDVNDADARQRSVH